MPQTIGQIALDLVVNRNGFDRQMSGIQSLAKKAGAALAGAFAIKKLADFGKSCLELGSDLSEVQNVVDVTFPAMAQQVEDFAKSAMNSFGLSETMAKQYTGTFGAMAKAFGFAEQQAYEMGSTLTGLAGDVASFYNITQDEAYTKLKSVFTGETESLKDLGVVMTQTALDAYAMANGFGKTTAQMSEAEKVALRYSFVQNQLNAAAGDFSRTSGSWANQVRILKLQFDSLRASIGQGLINILTPAIQAVNALMGRLVALANAFKGFTELITGKKSEEGNLKGLGNSAQAAGAGLSDAAGNAQNLADNTSGVGEAAKKAAKEMKALMGFDAINKLAEPPDVETGDTAGSPAPDIGGTGIGTGAADFGKLAEGETVVDKLTGKLKKLIDRGKELARIFGKGFKIGFGDGEKNIKSIKNHINGIGKSLKKIFMDGDVAKSAGRLMESIAENAGKAAGAFTKIGLTIANNLAGGIDKYLKGSKDFLKKRLVGIMDVSADIADLFGNICKDIADIFSAFSNNDGKTITASMIGIFADAWIGSKELTARAVRSVMSVIGKIIGENKRDIKKAIENTLLPIAKVAESLHGLVKDAFEKMLKAYEEYVEPAAEKIGRGLSDIFKSMLDAYNEYLSPVIGWIADRFSKLVTEYVQPLIDAFLEFAGKAIGAIAGLWEYLSPFITWFIEDFAKKASLEIEGIWNAVEGAAKIIADSVKTTFQVLSGLIDFITGVFTGDWELAWSGVKKIFESVSEFIGTTAETIKETVSMAFGNMQKKIKTSVDSAKENIDIKLNAARKISENVFGSIRKISDRAMSNVKKGIRTSLKAIADAFEDKLGAVQRTVRDVFGGMWDIVRETANSMLGGVESMVNGIISGINNISYAFNSMSVDIPDWVPGIGGQQLGFNLPTFSGISLPRLAQGGYVKANTPQLAMIGDNRHQGEVVAPEDKLLQMAKMAAGMSAGTSPEVLNMLKEIIRLLNAIEPVAIDEESLRKYFIKKTNQNTKARGKPELIM